MKLYLCIFWVLLNFFVIENFVETRRTEYYPNKRSLLSKKLVQKSNIMSGIFSIFSSEKQINTNEDIPNEYYNQRKSFLAMVEKVIDGDTYRVRHLPGGKLNKYSGKLNDNTIKVRIAAVDTPEIAKNGHLGQKFSEEAKLYAEKKLLNQKVTIKILSKDQYGRVIGRVYYEKRTFFGLFSSKKDIAESLLIKGLATVYRQGGAQYDGPIEHWNLLEENAKRKKLGIWSGNQPDLPSAYKAKIRENSNRI